MQRWKEDVWKHQESSSIFQNGDKTIWILMSKLLKHPTNYFFSHKNKIKKSSWLSLYGVKTLNGRLKISYNHYRFSWCRLLRLTTKSICSNRASSVMFSKKKIYLFFNIICPDILCDVFIKDSSFKRIPAKGKMAFWDINLTNLLGHNRPDARNYMRF